MSKKILGVINKFSLLFVLVFVLILIPIIKVNAFTFSPDNTTKFPLNSTIQITLNAAPNAANEYAVQIRLLASNIQITGFTPTTASGWVGATTDCSGGSYFTATTICASIAKSTPITQGEPLGVITATITGDPANLTKQSDNAYSDGSALKPDNNGGVAYSIGSGSATGGTSNLPSTAFGNSEARVFILLLGITVIIMILVISRVIDISKDVRKLK